MSTRAFLRTPAGFTIVELLTVVAIMSILVSLGMVSLRGISGGSNLATSGSKLAGLLESARAESILKRQPVAVVMLLSGSDGARRAFAALEYVPADAPATPSWKQVSRWETLPDGVIADTQPPAAGALASVFSTDTSVTVTPTLPALKYRGTSFNPGSGYGYVIFMPDGSIYQASQSCALSLIPGFWNGSDVQRAGTGNNYLQIVVNDATGRVKVVRP